MMFFISNFASNSVICPEYITTPSHPWNLLGKYALIFPIPFYSSLMPLWNRDETLFSNTYAKLKIVILQNSIRAERQKLSRRKIRKQKKQWELQLSYAFVRIWSSYEEDRNIFAMGPSRVRGTVSTGQGSDHVTDYLYALFSKHWISIIDE